MQWLNVAAQVLAIAVAASVLTACAVEVGPQEDGNGWYSKFTTLPRKVPGEFSQPETLSNPSPPLPLLRNPAKGNLRDANGNVARKFPID